jgi:thiol-disulfide isomerase/thioredoxin
MDGPNTDADSGREAAPESDRDSRGQGQGEAQAEAEALLDALLEEAVLLEYDDGTLATTEAFESTRGVYADSYADAADEVFRSTVADLFGLDEAEAERRIEAEGVTREMLIAHLAVGAHVDGEYATDELARMAMLVVDVDPASPVPRRLEAVDDDSYRAFLAANDRAVVTVWKRNCAPCDALKEDLDDLLAALPDDAAVAGLDGTSPAVADFRRRYEVEAAPSILLFREGDLAEAYQGKVPADVLGEAADRVYGDPDGEPT